MTALRALIAMIMVTVLLLLQDYRDHLDATHRLDFSQVQTVRKINGVPTNQLPDTLTGASGIFKERLAPLDIGVPMSALLYPSNRPAAGREPAAPPAATSPPVPVQVTAR